MLEYCTGPGFCRLGPNTFVGKLVQYLLYHLCRLFFIAYLLTLWSFKSWYNKKKWHINDVIPFYNRWSVSLCVRTRSIFRNKEQRLHLAILNNMNVVSHTPSVSKYKMF
jgi:hypothetical protein